MKVIGVGFQKTGTSTLEDVFKILGYDCLGPRTKLAKNLFENDLKPVFEIADDYNAYQDNPWPLLYKELDQRYPGSKFILTLRSEEKWIKSLVNHFGNTHTEMRRWIYGYGDPIGNEDVYLKIYREHNKAVQEYFKNREQDLLIVSWERGDEWEKICSFLDKPIPKIPFPHSNQGRYEPRWKKMMKNLLRPVIKRKI